MKEFSVFGILIIIHNDFLLNTLNYSKLQM